MGKKTMMENMLGKKGDIQWSIISVFHLNHWSDAWRKHLNCISKYEIHKPNVELLMINSIHHFFQHKHKYFT